jgi:hypothetical protein
VSLKGRREKADPWGLLFVVGLRENPSIYGNLIKVVV